MPRPRLDHYQYMTTTAICEGLGISLDQLNRRLELGILPPPSRTMNGVRYFDHNWLRLAKDILKRDKEGAEI